MKSLTVLTLILSLVTQPMVRAAKADELAFDQVQESALLELDMLSSDIESDSADASSRRKIKRRFDRQFAKFSKRIHSLTDRYSEAELRASLEDYTVRNGNLLDELAPNGRGQDPIEGILLQSQQGELKSALLALVSDDRKAELYDRLNAEIEKAGSARAYLKQTRGTLKSLNGCLLKKIALIGLVIPAGAGLVFGGVALMAAVTYGGAMAGVGVWGTVGIAAASITGGGGGVMSSLDYLHSNRGNCRFEKRR